MEDDMLFGEHSHLIKKGVSAFFILYVFDHLVRIYKSLLHFSHKKS